MKKNITVKNPNNVIEIVDAIRGYLREEKTKMLNAHAFYRQNPQAETNPQAAAKLKEACEMFTGVTGEGVLDVIKNYVSSLDELNLLLFEWKMIVYRNDTDRDGAIHPDAAEFLRNVISSYCKVKIV